MKKTTYVIIAFLALGIVLQIVFFFLLKSTGVPYSEFAKSNDNGMTVRTESSEVMEEVVMEDEDYVTSLEVSSGDDVEVIIKVKNPDKLKRYSEWRRVIGKDSISANTLMLNVNGNSTIKVKIDSDE